MGISEWTGSSPEHQGVAIILFGPSGDAKHQRAFALEAEQWGTKQYVDDRPVILRLDRDTARLDTVEARRQHHAQKVQAFMALMMASVTFIGLVTGNEETITGIWADTGAAWSSAIELRPVPGWDP